MKSYSVKLSYTLVEETPERAKPFDKAEIIAEEMRKVVMDHRDQEGFYVIYLNRKNYKIAHQMVTLGTLSASLVHPREVFRGAILAGAAAIICAHNHPSGDPAPSSADIQVTRQLREAANIIAIDLLDHVIVGEKESDPAGLGYYSFRMAGHL